MEGLHEIKFAPNSWLVWAGVLDLAPTGSEQSDLVSAHWLVADSIFLAKGDAIEDVLARGSLHCVYVRFGIQISSIKNKSVLAARFWNDCDSVAPGASRGADNAHLQ